MKHNYNELLDNNLSINSYLWPNNRSPFEFIETIAKARMTSPKKANETLRGASATNPLGVVFGGPNKRGGRGGGY